MSTSPFLYRVQHHTLSPFLNSAFFRSVYPPKLRSPDADAPCGKLHKYLQISLCVSMSLYPLQAFASTQFSCHKLFLAKAVDKSQEIRYIIKGVSPMPPSSRGLGHLPFTEVTGIRIPLGVLKNNKKQKLFYSKSRKQNDHSRFFLNHRLTRHQVLC